MDPSSRSNGQSIPLGEAQEFRGMLKWHLNNIRCTFKTKEDREEVTLVANAARELKGKSELDIYQKTYFNLYKNEFPNYSQTNRIKLLSNFMKTTQI